MRHLILCREYPPAPNFGGIGTYAFHISRLLAGSGEMVHVIAVLWRGAPRRLEELLDGRLVIHRISLDELEGRNRHGIHPPFRWLPPSQLFS